MTPVQVDSPGMWCGPAVCSPLRNFGRRTMGVTGTGQETPDLPYCETDTTLQKKWLFTS